MKHLVVALLLWASATCSWADSRNPVFGKWTWTTDNNCTEVYYYRPDGISQVTSGGEVSEGKFTVSDGPDQSGFYRMTDEVTKSNGKTGCDGEPGGTPVGDKVTVFMFIKPSRDEMAICMEPSFKACFGPLHRAIK